MGLSERQKELVVGRPRTAWRWRLVSPGTVQSGDLWRDVRTASRVLHDADSTMCRFFPYALLEVVDEEEDDARRGHFDPSQFFFAAMSDFIHRAEHSFCRL